MVVDGYNIESISNYSSDIFFIYSLCFLYLINLRKKKKSMIYKNIKNIVNNWKIDKQLFFILVINYVKLINIFCYLLFIDVLSCRDGNLIWNDYARVRYNVGIYNIYKVIFYT